MRRIIALHVLVQHGGIILEHSYSLVEDLKWVKEVYSNPYVNRLDRSYPTEVVGFFDVRKSSERFRKLTQDDVNAPFMMLRPSTGLVPTFVAAREKAPFLIELCTELRKPSTLLPFLKDRNEIFEKANEGKEIRIIVSLGADGKERTKVFINQRD